MTQSEISFIKIEGHDNPTPSRSTSGSAGYDLRSREELNIPSGGWKLVRTGYRVSMPRGIEAQVRSRSGLALKHGVSVLNGVGTIDSDYDHEIGVILMNHSDRSFQINIGDRIAQLVFSRYIDTGDVVETQRDGGFGSTGRS